MMNGNGEWIAIGLTALSAEYRNLNTPGLFSSIGSEVTV